MIAQLSYSENEAIHARAYNRESMKKKTYKISSKTDKLSGLQTLQMEGDLSIKNASSIKNELTALGYTGSKISIHLLNIASLDLTGIQLVYALLGSLKLEGKETEMKADLPEDLMKLAGNAGFKELIN